MNHVEIGSTCGIALRTIPLAATFALLVSAGCGGTQSQTPASGQSTASGETTVSSEVAQAATAVSTAATAGAGSAPTIADSSAAAADRPPASSSGSAGFAPLSLSALAGSRPTTTASSVNAASAEAQEQQIQSVIAKLQPMQIMLGQWRGTTRREYEGFKSVDAHEWIWDLRTNPSQPALVMTSDKSPYLRSARLTWDNTRQQYSLTATDGQGVSRQYYGDFTEPVSEVVGSDDKLHRVYRLELSQDEATVVNGAPPTEFWQVAFAQQENNRYLLEVGQRRPKTEFRRYDTVSTQREGTSFALSDTDYAEKTCIISEGLGTTEIVYKGRSYWVCCSGCKAAFEEDPEKWIARSAKRAAEKK